jgi:hypothetical protein
VNPLALYPSYTRNRILWTTKDFQDPALPVNPVTPVLATSAAIFNAALAGNNKTITVPTTTALGSVGGAVGNDIEIVVQAGASIQKLSTNGGSRIRIRGPGKIGGVSPSNGTDWVFDGVIFAPDSLGIVTTVGELFQMARIAFLHCVGRAHVGGHPTFFVESCDDVLWANNNWSVHDGNLVDGNCWVLRISPTTTCNRYLFIDTTMQTFRK